MRAVQDKAGGELIRTGSQEARFDQIVGEMTGSNENTVPNGALMSTLFDPSSGSIATTIEPSGFRTMTSAASSDATAAAAVPRR